MDSMTDEEFDRIVSATAFAVPSRPVPQDVLLAALLDQQGHYVSEKIVDLMGVAGVAPRGGVVLITQGCDRAIVPPGAVVREAGEYDVLFYRERWVGEGDVPPWVGTAEPTDPHIFVPCAAACARWGAPNERLIFYPWGYLHHLERWDAEPAGDPAVFHAESFARGSLHGTVAVAAGRLGDAVLAIGPARWLFPAEAE